MNKPFLKILLLLIPLGAFSQASVNIVLNRNIWPVYSWNSKMNHLFDSIDKIQYKSTYRAGDFTDGNIRFTLVLDNGKNNMTHRTLYVCKYKSDSVFVGGGIGINQATVIVYDVPLIVKVGDIEYKVTVHKDNDIVNISKVSGNLLFDLEFTKSDLPDVPVQLLYGGKVSLKSYEHKSSYIYLEFWGTWCGHCLPAMDDLKKVYDKYHDKITVISIAFNEPANMEQVVDTNDIKNVVESHHADWLQGVADKYITRFFYLNYAPRGILYDTNGNIIKWDMSVKELEEFLKTK